MERQLNRYDTNLEELQQQQKLEKSYKQSLKLD